jgi:endonuclease YncB( thermonuclease family)
MKQILVLILILAFPPAALAQDHYSARVIGITDGDTIKVLTADKQQIKIRLYGIDCPERRQAWGNRAREAASEAVFGKDVYIYPVNTDRYGRVVAIVAAPGQENLNAWLVKSGLAWVYPQYCKRPEICDRLRALEQEAREDKIGLWADKNPVAPWEWRRNK